MNELSDNYRLMFTAYPDVVNVDQMRTMLGGIGVTLAYRLLKEKMIHSIKIGREYKIPKNNVITYVMAKENN